MNVQCIKDREFRAKQQGSAVSCKSETPDNLMFTFCTKTRHSRTRDRFSLSWTESRQDASIILSPVKGQRVLYSYRSVSDVLISIAAATETNGNLPSRRALPLDLYTFPIPLRIKGWVGPVVATEKSWFGGCCSSVFLVSTITALRGRNSNECVHMSVIHAALLFLMLKNKKTATATSS